MGFIHCNLRVLMAERGLNIQKVKDKTSLSRTTISNLYNNNGAGIQFDTLKQLCELLKCQPGDLLVYIDIVPEFKVITEEPNTIIEEETHGVDDEENGHEDVSSIKTDLDIYCKLRYEGNTHDLQFQVEIKYEINENKNMECLNVGISPEFEHQLYELKLPPHAVSYVFDEFDAFLVNWGHDWFNGKEIEGNPNLTINHYDLQK